MNSFGTTNAYLTRMVESARRAEHAQAYSYERRGAFTGTLRMIHRYDSALRSNVHLHTLALDRDYGRRNRKYGQDERGGATVQQDQNHR